MNIAILNVAILNIASLKRIPPPGQLIFKALKNGQKLLGGEEGLKRVKKKRGSEKLKV